MRYAVFVDAGYLYSQGSKAAFGTLLNRIELELNPPEIISKLTATAADKTEGAPLLRIYWYDGLLHGRPSADQRQLAEMENLKLRFGVVNVAGQQKGVDTLMVTDLVELARNRVISDAMLLSGDADLKVGVEIAQGFGVRVHLIGIEPKHESQSRDLLQEADTSTEWSAEELQSILSRKVSAAPVTATPSIAVETPPEQATLIPETAAIEVISALTDQAIQSLVSTVGTDLSAHIPQKFDRPLLAAGRTQVGRDLTEPERVELRHRFLEMVRARAAALPPG